MIPALTVLSQHEVNKARESIIIAEKRQQLNLLYGFFKKKKKNFKDRSLKEI